MASASATISDEKLTGLIAGAVDLRCLSGPSVMRRPLDHLEAAREAQAAGLRGIVFKDHYYSVTPVTAFLRTTYFKDAPIKLISGVVLNNAVGGLNVDAVEHTLKLGGRVIWMPTISATNHIRQMHRSKPSPTNAPMMPQTALTVVNERGFMKDEVKGILDLIAKHDAVLAAGHLHVSEVIPLFKEAKARGVKRKLVSHPTVFVDAKMEEMTQLAGMGAFIEHNVCDLLPRKIRGEDLAAFIKAAGIGQTILGCDLGHLDNPRPADGFRQVARLCLELGFSADDIRRMISVNPCRLLGIGA